MMIVCIEVPLDTRMNYSVFFRLHPLTVMTPGYYEKLHSQARERAHRFVEINGPMLYAVDGSSP